MRLPEARPGTFKRLMRLVFAERVLMLLIVLFSLAGNALMLMGPLWIGRAIDVIDWPGGVQVPALLRILILLATFYIFGNLLHWLLGQLSARLSAHVTRTLRHEIYQHVDAQPLSFFDRTPHGEIANRIGSDMDAINEGLIAGLPQIFSGLVTLCGSLVLMFRLHVGVTLIVVALTPLTVLLSAYITGNARQYFAQQTRATGELNGLAEEVIENHALIESLQGDEEMAAHFARLNSDLYTVGQKAQFFSSLTNPSTRLVNATAYILVGLYASLLAVRGVLSIGNIASLLNYANQFSKPINEITSVVTQFQAALASAGRVFQLLDQPGEQPEPADMPACQVTAGEIRFDRVSFSYTPDRPLIQALNAKVPAGAQIAIVGPTGSGKTTLVNLLMRFYELDHGRILIDQQEIARCTKASVRRSFGMVLQDVWLFEGSIRDNLAFGRSTATDAEIQAAARAVGADNFIRRLPKGYDTLIGKDVKLSAGQSQLLTIVRTWLAEPQLLILDEATSNIDTVTERRVQQAFRQLMQGRTSIIIAHRLSTILDADEIWVMERGRLVEAGTHQALLARGGLYHHLYQSQFAGQSIDDAVAQQT